MRPQSSLASAVTGLVRPNLARFLGSAAVTAMLAASLGGCQTMSDVTGALTQKSSAARSRHSRDPRRAVEVYGERYRANPKDADAALAYGQALRASGQRAQAAAVLEQATIAHPGNKALLAGYGRALADNGNSQPPSTCSAAPIRPTIPTGASSRCRAPRSTRWAGTTKHAAITTAR